MSMRSKMPSALAAVMLAVLATSARADDAEAPPPPHAPGEMIIHFAAPPTPRMIADVEAVLGAVTWHAPRHAAHAKGLPGTPHPLASFRVAKLAADADVIALAGDVAALPHVQFATTNNTPEPAGFPNDPMFGDQWSHAKINSQAGWAIGTGDTSVIVGVIDTGCRVTHEDLVNHLWVNDDPVNGVDDDGNGFVDDTFGWDFARNVSDISDVYGHGTQATGIVAGEIDNGLGVSGMANVTVMTSKWWHSSGTDCSVAEAVFYAVDNGAHVLNLSLSCGCLLPMSETAVLYAAANDVVVVCSAGNGGSSSLHYPASYPDAMAISAIDIGDGHPSFSSYGSHIDVAAPSPDILTCDESSDSSYDPFFRGTSAAAPHVAGLAGLVRSVNPALTAVEVRDAINANATDVGAAGFDDFFGNGRIDVGATVAAIASTCASDLDGDDAVTFNDLLALLAAWGPCAACPEDLDGSGTVAFNDLLMLLAAWGPCS